MSKELKRTMAEEVREALDASPNVLVVGLLPMNAETNLELRNRLREQGANLRVIHNRSSRHALDEARAPLADHFVGQTALALTKTEEPDLIPVAKLLLDASKQQNVELRGGYVDGELLDKAGFEALALSPDKPTLRAMLCGAILGTARGIAVSLQAVGGGLARCLQARIDEQGGTEATSE